MTVADDSSAQWIPGPNLPYPNYAHLLLRYNETVYFIIGGISFLTGINYASGSPTGKLVFSYDWESGNFTPLAPLALGKD